MARERDQPLLQVPDPEVSHVEPPEVEERNMMTTGTSADLLCIHCGRPVIGMQVWGALGPYHPECTQPPKPVLQAMDPDSQLILAKLDQIIDLLRKNSKY